MSACGSVSVCVVAEDEVSCGKRGVILSLFPVSSTEHNSVRNTWSGETVVTYLKSILKSSRHLKWNKRPGCIILTRFSRFLQTHKN